MNPPIDKMKAPGDYRPTAWLGRVLQIKISNACDLDCQNCSVGVGLARKLKKIFIMPPAQFRRACQSLRGFTGVIGVFGGNPCLHPAFDEICAIFREEVPNMEQRGLWSNNLFGHGATCRATFNPRYSNLNVHERLAAYQEMKRDWPEANPVGLNVQSHHGPIFGSMQELGLTEAQQWDCVSRCYVNQTWSAEITMVDDELLGFFCEIAATMAEITHDAGHGMPIKPGWWARPMGDFEDQVKAYCTKCLIPLNARKIDAESDDPEEYTAVWSPVLTTIKGRPMKRVKELEEISAGKEPATRYLG